MKRYCAFLLFVLLVHPRFAWSQNLLKIGGKEVIFGRWFDATIGRENTPLMQGKIYAMSPSTQMAHPFFLTKFWTSGKVVLAGQHYAHVPLLFDLEKELLVMQHPDPQRWDGIILDFEDLEAFELQGHVFKKLDITNANGFYDMLYEGDSVSLVAKREKNALPRVEGIDFETIDQFYVLVGKKLLPVTNYLSLRRNFKEQKLLLRAIRREEKIKFKASDEPQMILFIQAFDQLLKE